MQNSTVKAQEKKFRRQHKRRTLLSSVEHAIAKAQEQRSAYSRQVAYDDMFQSMYDPQARVRILRPPYSPEKMYELYEESDALSACVEAYVQNTVGFGWEIVPPKGVEADEDKQFSAEKTKAEELFTMPNGTESFRALCELLRRDFEVTGNAFLEVVRNRGGEPSLLFWMDAKRTRLCALDTEEVQISETVIRGGGEIQIPVMKRFRKYAMVSDTGVTLRFFKEFGDPRTIDAETGAVLSPAETDPRSTNPRMPATEVLHFKFGNSAYGVPRWIATLLAVMGSAKAAYVNYDLFDSQGIPPMIISVAGGQLTEDSVNDLKTLLCNMKNVKNFHKILLLETESDGSLDGKGSTSPKVEVQGLSEHRKEDAMFLNYLSDCRTTIQQMGFRLPGMFVGVTNDYNRATAFVARQIAEEQIFLPERTKFAEVITSKLLRGIGVSHYVFQFKAPVIKSQDDLIAVLPALVDKGAFTINELIRFMNENFGTNLLPYDGDGDEWADLPIPFVLSVSGPTMSQEEDEAPEDSHGAAGTNTFGGDDKSGTRAISKNQKVYEALLSLERVADRFLTRKCACGDH